MNNGLQNALDKIQAGGALKDSTARFLREKINGRGRASARPRLRFAAVSAAAALLIFISGLSYNLYFTPNAYVDMDVNPSVGLTLNRFGRVIGAQAYNGGGDAVLAAVSVRFKTYGEAAGALLDAVIAEGYLAEGGLVSVTVQASGDMENDILAGLHQTVAASLAGHHADTDIYAVTGEIRTNAQEHHVTPAMYLAVTELQEVDPAATFEGCMGRSIPELREMAREHGGSHHGQMGETGDAGSETGDASSETGAEVPPESPPYGQMGGHHGGRGNGHGNGM